MIEWTGERYVPWANNVALGYEHIHRYLIAREFAGNRMVVDLASGEGYGSAILAEVAAFAVGIDIDPDAVAHAQGKYGRSNLTFSASSMTSVALLEDKVSGLVTCFEALEHIVDHAALLSEVKRLLRPDGIFIVSTPNKRLYTDASGQNNPYHQNELYLEQFKSLLDGSFRHCRIFGQRVLPTCSIFPMQESDRRHRDFAVEMTGDGLRQTGLEKREPMYYIAIASDAELPHEALIGGSTLTDISSSLFLEYEKRILSAQRSASTPAVWPASLQAAMPRPHIRTEKSVQTPEPTRSEPLDDLGRMLFAEGKYHEALNVFEERTHEYPDDYTNWNDLGVTLSMLGRMDKAFECFMRALSLKGDYADALENIKNLSKIEAAQAQVKPEAKPVGSMSLGEMGTRLFNEGDYDRALKFFLKVLELHPDDADNLNNLAAVYVKTGRLDEAQTSLDRAIAAHPGHKATLDNMELIKALRSAPPTEAKPAREERRNFTLNEFLEFIWSSPSFGDMSLNAFGDGNSYEQYLQNFCAPRFTFEALLAHSHKDEERWSLEGFCEFCQKPARFFVPQSQGLAPNFREALICEHCGLNNRWRFIMHMMGLLSAGKMDDIYVYEQTTPLYRMLVKKHGILSSITGSEYLGPDRRPGDVIDGIRHEDAMALSFKDNSFDVVISCDVFEHVPDISRTLKETARVLRPGGKALITVPYVFSREKTEMRAVIENGKVRDLLEPIYHGNPIDPKGSLVFYDFGKDFIELLRADGFSSALLLGYYSVLYGYLGGGMQPIFIAEK